MKTYTAVVERCPDTKLFVGFIPGFPGAHSQGATQEELTRNLREVVAMLLEDGEPSWKLNSSVPRPSVFPEHGKHPHPEAARSGPDSRQLGFSEVRQRGSHKQYRHPDGRGTTVPFHSGRDISPFLLRQIAKDIGLTIEDFISHR